jgi:hypothetical protein
MLSALRRSPIRVMKLRWGCGPAVLRKVFAGRLDIAPKDLGHVQAPQPLPEAHCPEEGAVDRGTPEKP